MSTPPKRSPHVLVADDDEATRGVLTHYLQRNGYQVTCVTDGQQALEALARTSDFDVVLLDVMMPRQSGFDVLRQARAGGNPLPIIMATAAANESDVVQALNLGADDYVTKPFSLPVLLARLQARIRVRPARVEASPARPKESLVSRLKSMAGRLQAAPTPQALAEGDTVADRYLIGSRLGAGTFGTVYRALHIDLKQDVALKVLSGHGSPDTVELFRKEAQMACRVHHPNAVRVYDFGLLPPTSAFLVMELVDGPSLDEVLRRQGRLEPSQAIAVCRTVLSALGAAHRQGLVHCDVKPANVVMHHQDTPKLLDFGLARAFDDTALDGELPAGSPAYTAPERFKGESFDGKADVYACGIMLFKLLTGVLPITGDLADFDNIERWHLHATPPRPSSLNRLVSPTIDAVVLKFLEKEPSKRPAADEAESLLETVAWG